MSTNSAAERKRDARDKIILGGLIVKAGLRDADRAFILGVLEAAATIPKDSEQYAAFLAAGRRSLTPQPNPQP